MVCKRVWAGVLCAGLTVTQLAGAADLHLASWNMDWLMTPAAHDELASRCTRTQPRSDERALPCTPGRTPPPARTAADLLAMSHTAERLRDEAHADLVGLQEVDGAGAAAQVFRSGWKLDCFVQRAHPQKVGFAIREGIPYQCNGDLQALDIDGGSRPGADITLYPGTPKAIRVLAVHLKSGCFDGRLDRSFSPCTRLRQQVPVLEQWVDARVREGMRFAVLGDFNRHLDKDARYPAGPDEGAPLNLFAALDDDEPKGAHLVRGSALGRYTGCSPDDTHQQFIDDVLVDAALADKATRRSFRQLPFQAEDTGKQLSDHCPVVMTLEGVWR
ncbi:endonuclease/exonuclease/phosphatase family protein [Aquabacterium sp.]|uniref:endonuclease/exonuclease/phosphatase family protein n=1 Tax=Aquabacterium sp. TaxID=1872578 RepID=UPI0035B215B1